MLAEPLYLLAATLAGLVLVARRRPRVIHAHGVRPGGAVALALAALTRRPFVLSEYANPFSGYLATGPRRAVARAVVRRAAGVCVRSAFSRAQIEAAGMHGRFVSIPHTVDTGLFHPGAGERPDGAALYVGRLASGLPVLTSDVGGLPELVGPHEGRLVAAGSPEAWGQALSRMAAEAGSFDRTAIARAAAARFSHEAVAAQLLELYSATAQ